MIPFFKPKQTLVLFLILFILISDCRAEDNYLTLSYGQIDTDFLAEENRKYKPTTNSIGYGYKLSDSWSFDLSYEKSKGSGEWFSHKVLRQSFYESGQSESKAFSTGLTWFAEEHGVNFSYSSLNYDESSITYLPFLIETVESENNAYLISYIGQWSSSAIDFNNSLESLLNESVNSWEISWNIGLQSIDANADIVELLNADNPIKIDIQLNQESLSAFADVEIEYLILNDSVSYSPYLSLGWNWGIDVSGEEYILLSRGDQSVSFEQSGSRFNNQIKTPDSGQYEFGVKLYWESGKTENSPNESLDWVLNISYSRSVETAVEYNATRVTLKVGF